MGLTNLFRFRLYTPEKDFVEYLTEYGVSFEPEEFMDIFYDWLEDVQTVW